MIACDPRYRIVLQDMQRRLMEQHPTWSLARIKVRAIIELAKLV